MSTTVSPVGGGAIEEVTRIERKFLVPRSRTGFLGAWLRHACTLPERYPEGIVHSLYYDTADWDAYFESVDGDTAKRKIRLRWYDSPGTTANAIAYVESKEKWGATSLKRRSPVTVDGAAIAAGAFQDVLPRRELEDALGLMGVFPRERLVPAVVVTYHRLRFVEPSTGMHLALDDRLEARAVRPRSTGRIARIPEAVLELKGQSLDVPVPLIALKRWVSAWSSHSKYARAVEALQTEFGAARLFR